MNEEQRRKKSERNKAYNARPDVKAKRRDHSLSDKERAKQKARSLKHNSTDEAKRKAAEYRESQHGRSVVRDYYEKNKDAIRLRHKRNSLTIEGRASRSASDAKRRALKKQAEAGDAKEIVAWMRRWKSLKVVSCHWCESRLPPRLAHADHIFPIGKGGAHSLCNLCVSCSKCNTRKKDRHPDTWAQALVSPPLL